MHRNSARNAGFTLTELLVASAIFLILMTALVTLFNAAVTSARQGYASIDAGETGRQANMVISRDLTSSFTAREHGDVYNFYGRHDGFMFVGALDNGQIGRVTYVFHPDANDYVYTTLTERWRTIEANVRSQIERVAREYGYTGVLRRNAADEAIARLRVAYPPPANPEAYVTIDVRLRTEHLIRYEEYGRNNESSRNNLDTFDMVIDSTGTTVLDWPYLDMLDSDNDATPVGLDGSPQLRFIRSALSPDPDTTNSPYDLRNMFTQINRVQGGEFHPVTNDRIYLRVLGPDTFQQLVNARKREFWLRMLSGDQSLGLPSLSKDTNPAADNGCWGYWYDEEYGRPNGRNRRILNQYVVASGIVGAAEILLKDTTEPIWMFDGTPPLLFDAETLLSVPDTALDALDADVRFAYGDGNAGFTNYFNALENLADLDNPYRTDNIYAQVINGSGVIYPVDLVEADSALADAMVGSATRVDPTNPTQTIANRALLGSPLRPRIPQVVTTDFWVTRTRTRPGAPDIIKRFTQTIQIPAAHGRSVSTTVARGPGASL